MRKHIKLICAMLIAAVLLASSGCAHGASPAAQSPADTAAEPITIAEPQAPTETVMGYVSTEVETPEWVESFKCSAPVGDWFHTAAYTTDGGIAVASYDTLNDAWQRYDLGTEPAICPTVEFFSAAEGSFWVVLRESYMDAEISAGDHSRALNYYLVYIDAETGEQTCSYLAWDEHQPYYMALIALDKDRALLSDGETTYLLDPMAEVIDTPPLEILGGGLHVYVDGEMYVGTYDGVAHLDKAALQYTDTVSKMKDQPVYGSCLGRFLTTKDSTLYSVSLSDEETELFSWMDVSLSYSRLYGWDGLENYSLQESALNKLFFQTYPNNTNIDDVLIKVSSLNDFYSTNIFSPFQVAKHIISLNIDARLVAGDVTLVNDIAKVTMDNGTVRNFYSFATKYCSHHMPLEFPIYDSYVDRLLRYFRDTDRFSRFSSDDLKDYEKFKNILIQFTSYYRLEPYNLKEIDKYLWQLGKEKFPRTY